MKYDVIAENSDSTVVSDYVSPYQRATSYQSEAELERELIKQLQAQAYEYLPIKGEADLTENLRTQLERLNDYTFTDAEWKRFFAERIANGNDNIADKTFKIQEDHIQLLKCDNGEERNIYLLDKTNIHRNYLQVINQYEVSGVRDNRYDVRMACHWCTSS